MATDTRHLGYCVTIDGNTNMWVSDISAPVIVGGVQQCTSGTFVPLTARKESP